MSSKITTATPLLTMRNVHIKGLSDETWVDIINGVDLDLRRGEVLGLIGESGAGKSTLGLGAMGFCRDGCKITDGSIIFDGLDLLETEPAATASVAGPPHRLCCAVGGC